MSREHRSNRRGGSRARRGKWRRLASWFAVVALVCQVGIPFGHNLLAEELGAECPGLKTAAHGDPDGGTAGDTDNGQASPQSKKDGHHSCPVCQLVRHSAAVAELTPILLPVPTFHYERRIVLAVAAPPALDRFSRPHPRAPPAQS